MSLCATIPCGIFCFTTTATALHAFEIGCKARN
jgi:hypothetical protein